MDGLGYPDRPIDGNKQNGNRKSENADLKTLQLNTEHNKTHNQIPTWTAAPRDPQFLNSQPLQRIRQDRMDKELLDRPQAPAQQAQLCLRFHHILEPRPS
ncbi:Uncharacterized protein DAT39_003231 [Clarias magur]|uniref:Uncharacterized protein n=1 Tax=Clarias magur TaxID=1594786 RepID=A0A8J4UFG3_CLAMG|nr:Uncharacterized protein DAT39_003231 [Clarias magur]